MMRNDLAHLERVMDLLREAGWGHLPREEVNAVLNAEDRAAGSAPAEPRHTPCSCGALAFRPAEPSIVEHHQNTGEVVRHARQGCHAVPSKAPDLIASIEALGSMVVGYHLCSEASQEGLRDKAQEILAETLGKAWDAENGRWLSAPGPEDARAGKAADGPDGPTTGTQPSGPSSVDAEADRRPTTNDAGYRCVCGHWTHDHYHGHGSCDECACRGARMPLVGRDIPVRPFPEEQAAPDVTHDPYIPAFKRALTALALELPGPVYDDFKERAMAVVEAYERLAAGSAERELLADFASQVRATLSCKACSAVLPHHNGLRFALDAYDEAYGSQVAPDPAEQMQQRCECGHKHGDHAVMTKLQRCLVASCGCRAYDKAGDADG